MKTMGIILILACSGVALMAWKAHKPLLVGINLVNVLINVYCLGVNIGRSKGAA
jgi:hypothetical protein